MLIPPRNIQALACCAGACLQSFCTWGNFNRRKWGNFNRRKLGNIQPALTVSRVYPVMVVLDQTLTAPQVSRYLNDRFDRLALSKKHHKTITPLTIIDIENYERLVPYIELYGIGPLIESYYEAHVRHSRDQLIAFKPENIPYLDNRQLPERARERFREFLRSLGMNMFGLEDVQFPPVGPSD